MSANAIPVGPCCSPLFWRKKYRQISASTSKYRQIPVKSEKHLFLGFSQIRGNPLSTGGPGSRRTRPSQTWSNRVIPVKVATRHRKDGLPRISRMARIRNERFAIRACREIRGGISSLAASWGLISQTRSNRVKPLGRIPRVCGPIPAIPGRDTAARHPYRYRVQSKGRTGLASGRALISAAP